MPVRFDPKRKVPTDHEAELMAAILAGGSGYEGVKRSGKGAGFRAFNRRRELERLQAMGWLTLGDGGYAHGLTDAGRVALGAYEAANPRADVP